MANLSETNWKTDCAQNVIGQNESKVEYLQTILYFDTMGINLIANNLLHPIDFNESLSLFLQTI